MQADEMKKHYFGAENITGQQKVQTRFEAAVNIQKRQLGELQDLAYDINDILIRIRGEQLTENKPDGIEPRPSGFISELEINLQQYDDVILRLQNFSDELRTLI